MIFISFLLLCVLCVQTYHSGHPHLLHLVSASSLPFSRFLCSHCHKEGFLTTINDNSMNITSNERIWKCSEGCENFMIHTSCLEAEDRERPIMKYDSRHNHPIFLIKDENM
jgi:hypothetical protein